jgi:hypothetical protein
MLGMALRQNHRDSRAIFVIRTGGKMPISKGDGRMTSVLSIRLTIEDEAFMRRQMEIAGESKLGPHIKRVYYGNLNPGEGILAAIRRDLEMALFMLAKLAKAKDNEATKNIEIHDGETKQPDQSDGKELELRLLAGIYSMLHMSVNKDVRLMVDRYINQTAVDNFLKFGKSD